jgi:hypothetical protein
MSVTETISVEASREPHMPTISIAKHARPGKPPFIQTFMLQTDIWIAYPIEAPVPRSGPTNHVIDLAPSCGWIPVSAVPYPTFIAMVHNPRIAET